MGKKQETLELVGIEKELGEDALDKLSQMPLADFLHISLKKLEKGGAAECEMELDPSRHGNPNGTVQGGSLSTLADITTSFAVVALGGRNLYSQRKARHAQGKDAGRRTYVPCGGLQSGREPGLDGSVDPR